MMSSSSSPEVLFEEIDVQRAEGKQQDPADVYNKLLALYNTDDKGKDDIELLWRLARACNDIAQTLEQKNPKRKEVLLDGQKYAVHAYEINSNDFNVAKWAAALTGQVTDYLGTKEKIEQGNEFKKFLDKALSLNPEDHSTLHMRGRFAYNVAGLSWIERKVATTLFATPPVATHDEAIDDFLRVVDLKPDWLENRVFLVRCLLAKGDRDAAVQHLRKALELNGESGKDGIQDSENNGTADETERAMINEVKTLLQKHDK